MKTAKTPSGLVSHAATFDLGPGETADDMVRYENALIFRAGRYDQKKFEMSPAELKAAADAFTSPVPNEIEHVNTSGLQTIFDGKLGHVESVRLSDDGTELRGTVAIPRWLDGVWEGPSKQVSAVWNRSTKRLERLGLVVKGHVHGAALFSDERATLLSAFSDATGESVSLYGYCPKCGAKGASRERRPNGNDTCERGHVYPSRDALPRPMGGHASFTPRKTTAEDTGHWQAIHDHLIAIRPGLCSAAMGDRPKQVKGYRKIHDHAVEHGATCGGPAAMNDDHHQCRRCAARETNMTAKDRLKAKLGEKAATFGEVTEEQAAALLAAFGDPADDEAANLAAFASTPEGKAMAKRIADLEARDEQNRKDREAERKARVGTDAARFAEDLARPGHLPVYLKADFSALVERLADDDHAHPETVTFSDKATSKPGHGSRVDALVQFVAKLPSDRETPKIDPTADFSSKYKVLFNGDGQSSGDAESPEQRRARNLALTDVGRAALKAKAR